MQHFLEIFYYENGTLEFTLRSEATFGHLVCFKRIEKNENCSRRSKFSSIFLLFSCVIIRSGLFVTCTVTSIFINGDS